MELEPPPAADVVGSLLIDASKPAAAASANDDTTTEFLTEQERLKRVKKAKATKKAQKTQRDAAKLRWNEDVEDRKLAAQRRETVLNNKVQAEVSSGGYPLAQNSAAAGSAAAAAAATKRNLPKPFEEAVSDPQAISRQLIQQCMKDPRLTPKEKQLRIQELMRAGSGAISTAAAAASAANSSVASSSLEGNEMSLDDGPITNMVTMDMGAPKKDTDEQMENNGQEDEKPSAAAAQKAPPPPAQPNNMTTTRTITPPSTEWTQFVKQVPRCTGAEGIRDSSVFYKRNSSSASFDAAVPRCLKRLFKELDGLKDDLPADPNCSIWLRFDEETPQYIRGLLTAPLPGPTPYSGGLFAFDIYVPNDYPQTNPKVQLLTTGGGRVRFGPNLYADGKVCLSLLGTWAGPKWNPKHSSLHQILISIQGLILGVEHPYYLEPGHGGWEGTVKEGDFQVTGQTLAGQSVKQEVGVPLQVILYEDVLRVGTAKYAMVQPLKWSLDTSMSTMGKTGLEAFGEIVRAHFFENRIAILAEVRNWMSDHALGRNRSKALEKSARGIDKNVSGSTGTLQIDALQALLPKLEELLSKASMPQQSDGSTLKSAPAAASTDAMMDVEEESKPPATRPTSCTKEDDKEQQPDTSTTKRNTSTSGMDVVENKRQKMQEAADKGDFILAGKLQEEVKRLEDLQQGMQEAARQNDFIRAGRLQAQFKALTEVAATAVPKANANPLVGTALNNETNDDWNEEDGSDEDMGWNDDEMEEDGPQFPGQPHGLGSNAHHGGYTSHMSNKRSWGTGYTLAGPPAADTLPAVESTKKVVPQKSIPPDQLCRLRIRLPQDTSVVLDFEKNDSLAEVYRRLESMLPDQDAKQSPVGGPLVPGGAFSQPFSTAGFTLLLTRPKREFSLEMHGTKSLLELNLAPSATLTVMKCSDRGIMYRGEVESRLKSAQGDAMDVEGLTYEGLVELTERVGNAAPKEGDDFLTLSTEEYEANTVKISPSAYLADLDNSTEEHGEQDRRCPICLGCYDSSDNTPSLRTVKNCGHTMHAGCLQTWLRTNSSCPLCKVHIIEDSKKNLS